MPLTHAEVGQVGRYSATTMRYAPSNTPQQRRELERLADREDAQDDQDAVDEIPTNQALQQCRDEDEDDDELPAWLRDQLGKSASRTRRHRVPYDNTSLESALTQIEKSLSGEDVRGAVGELDEEVGSLAKSVAGQSSELDRLRWENRQLRAEREQDARRIATLERWAGATRREVRSLKKGLRDDWQEHHEAPRAEPSALVKAIADFLPDDCTRAQAERTALWVVKSFGPTGGQRCPCHGQLHILQQLTPVEKSLWQRFHRVPDHVNLAHAVPNPAAQAARDASILTQHAYASLGLSPLVFGSLARRS